MNGDNNENKDRCTLFSGEITSSYSEPHADQHKSIQSSEEKCQMQNKNSKSARSCSLYYGSTIDYLFVCQVLVLSNTTKNICYWHKHQTERILQQNSYRIHVVLCCECAVCPGLTRVSQPELLAQSGLLF